MRGPALLLALAAPAAAAAQQVDAEYARACYETTYYGNYQPRCRLDAVFTCSEKAGRVQWRADPTCFRSATSVWDVFLNEAYGTAMDISLRVDANAPDQPSEAASLRDAAQRAWIAYRDAECRRVDAAFASSDADVTSREVRESMAAHCLLDMTAQRTIELRDIQGP